MEDEDDLNTQGKGKKLIDKSENSEEVLPGLYSFSIDESNKTQFTFNLSHSNLPSCQSKFTFLWMYF